MQESGLFTSKLSLDHPKRQPAPELDLDNFDIDNFDSLPPWETDAHIWINKQILSIKNENYEQ